MKGLKEYENGLKKVVKSQELQPQRRSSLFLRMASTHTSRLALAPVGNPNPDPNDEPHENQKTSRLVRIHGRQVEKPWHEPTPKA